MTIFGNFVFWREGSQILANFGNINNCQCWQHADIQFVSHRFWQLFSLAVTLMFVIKHFQHIFSTTFVQKTAQCKKQHNNETKQLNHLFGSLTAFRKASGVSLLVEVLKWQTMSVAKIGRCCQLPKLAHVVGCQNWQILKTPKLPKLEFEHTCGQLSLSMSLASFPGLYCFWFAFMQYNTRIL